MMIRNFNIWRRIIARTVKIAVIPKWMIRVISDSPNSLSSRKKKITNIVWWMIQIRLIIISTTYFTNYFFLSLSLINPLNLNIIVNVFIIRNIFEFKRRDMKGMKKKSSIEKAYYFFNIFTFILFSIFIFSLHRSFYVETLILTFFWISLVSLFDRFYEIIYFSVFKAI